LVLRNFSTFLIISLEAFPATCVQYRYTCVYNNTYCTLSLKKHILYTEHWSSRRSISVQT
jgi:hypothetical protein